MKHFLLGPLMKLFCRPSIDGAEHVPQSGAAILVSNHVAVADSFFMPLMMPRRVTFLAKREYFTGTGIKGKFQKFFFSGVGQVPIDRSSGAAAQAALDTGVRLLREGKLLGVYPEGTRSPDGRLYKGKTGVARMALEAGVPVPVLAASDAGTLHPGIAHAGSLKSASEWRLRCIFSLVFRCSEAQGG